MRVRVYKGGREARGVGGVQVMVMLVVRKYYFYDNFFESTSRIRKKRSQIFGLKLLFDTSCDVLCVENNVSFSFKNIKMHFLDC